MLKGGDAGAAVNKAILTKGNPQGDVFFGVDNTLLSRALDNGLFTPYEAKGLDQVPAEFQLDKDKHRVTPVDTGDICVNYDKGTSPSKKLAPPQTFDDLTKPAVQEPARHRERRHLLARPRLPARHRRASTATRAGRTTGRSSRPTASRSSTAGSRPTTRSSPAPPAARRPRPTGRSSSPTPPARPPRCSTPKPAAERGADRRRDRHLLPADRVRGSAERREEREGRQGAARLPDQQEVPGGHAAATCS